MFVKQLKVNTIVCMKLQTGQEILCEYFGSEGMAYKIRNPLVITADGNGDIQIDFYMLGIERDKDVEILSNHVITISEPPKDMADNYKTMIGAKT